MINLIKEEVGRSTSWSITRAGAFPFWRGQASVRNLGGCATFATCAQKMSKWRLEVDTSVHLQLFALKKPCPLHSLRGYFCATTCIRARARLKVKLASIFSLRPSAFSKAA